MKVAKDEPARTPDPALGAEAGIYYPGPTASGIRIRLKCICFVLLVSFNYTRPLYWRRKGKVESLNRHCLDTGNRYSPPCSSLIVGLEGSQHRSGNR